ncbi:hypothetical protein CUMW_235190, partial [Citrus unshiu]
VFIFCWLRQPSGVIPTTIRGLKDLQYLFVEYNRLQGSIPDSIGDLINLKSLNLSNNNLSGTIPISLEKLLDLKDINVSFNKLEGEIPREGPFRNLSIKSFEGNELLCEIVLPLSTIFMIVMILLILRYQKRGKPLPNDANMPPLIGKGGFGSVYKAIIQDGMEVAVKVFDPQYEGAFKSFDIECDVMKRICHRNLIKNH